ncbi:MAG TPA: DUF3618 domain-containing protein [Arthrobacter sp.]|jgi:ElaB/YqjD/DUF883 family membrane-anchored ribosome-binding protein|nr:hypothetical protein [Arthrobacter sp.]HET6268741.1 DUF3618 domain-containing protein [Arthrobacter sp.]
MSTPVTPPNPEPPKDAGPEEIQYDIERTREELGETVEALASKLDFKAQARKRADSVKARAGSGLAAARKRASDTAESTRRRLGEISRRAPHHAPGDGGQQTPLIIAAAGVAGAVIGALISRAYTRSTRERSAAIALRPVRGQSPYPGRRHQGSTGQWRPARSTAASPGKSPKSVKSLKT